MLTIQEINTKIEAVKLSAKETRENIQTILVNAAGHAKEHGDVTTYTRLFKAVKGVDRKALTKWIAAYGFAILQKDGAFVLNKTARKSAQFADGQAVVDYLETQSPWYDMQDAPAEIIKTLNINARLKSLISQIDNATSDKMVVHVDFTEATRLIKALEASLQTTLHARAV